MLKVDITEIESVEKQYRGITEDIMRFENKVLPSCPRCGSEDTANVQIGVIGRTIHIAWATTKFKLIPNGPRPGQNFCNQCKNFFD